MPNQPTAPRRAPGTGTVHDLVARHCYGTRADATALVHRSRRVSYRELGEMTARVAAGLRRSGVREGEFVGVRMPRTPEAVAAMLGIMSAGAAYVPIDPADPPERTRHVIATAAIEVVLTAQNPLPAGDLVTAPPPAGDPAAPAYAIFTSGSTGTPKGAVMPHSALVNLLRWHERARPDSGRLRTAQLCSLSFDFSFHEIFSTLCGGGTLVLADDETRRNPFALAAFLRAARIERIFAPVTLLEQLAGAVEREPVELLLREVVTTGERLRITKPMRDFFRRVPARLHNHYGATEFQDATTWTLSGDPDRWPALPPIGRPVDGVRVHVVDDDLAEVETGVVGELCVAGAGLAQGYLRQPELTARRFVANPFGPGRLYRTGDLARRRPDGVLEHLGRRDTQIKAHGVRVEAGEIEALLLQHPRIGAAAVLAQEIAGQQRLVAHIVADAGLDTGAAPRMLDAFLAPSLPRHMRPELYAFRSAMPLTASGKTDRARLRAADGEWLAPLGPDLHAAVAPDEYEGRRVLVSSQVRRSLARILGESPQPDTDLFSAGLDSVSVILLRQALGKTLGYELQQEDVFRNPTENALTAHIVNMLEDGGER